jgi:hypothetical protein
MGPLASSFGVARWRINPLEELVAARAAAQTQLAAKAD